MPRDELDIPDVSGWEPSEGPRISAIDGLLNFIRELGTEPNKIRVGRGAWVSLLQEFSLLTRFETRVFNRSLAPYYNLNLHGMNIDLDANLEDFAFEFDY